MPVDSGFVRLCGCSDFARESERNSRGNRGDLGGRILATSTKRQRLLDAYRFPGFWPVEDMRGVSGDPHARIVILVRRSKKRSAAGVDESIPDGTTASFAGLVIFRRAGCAYTWSSKCGALRAGSAAR